MLEALAHNGTLEERFADAAYCLHLLAVERLRTAVAGGAEADGGAQGAGRPRGRGGALANGGGGGGGAEVPAGALAEYRLLSGRAEAYYAYSLVHRFQEEPFTTEAPETIFQ